MRLLIAAIALATLPRAASAADDARIAAAAKAAACPREANASFGADLGPLPGSADPSLQVVATLSGGTDAETLGTHCVALVGEDHGRLARRAGLVGASIGPPNQIEQVSTIYVNVDKTPFRFRPGETAFAVTADGEYNSEVTNWNWATLYLFRRQGAAIIPIFHAKVADETIDKTGQEKTTGGRWVVRFDTVQHRGTYDLILQKAHGTSRRRYAWDGARYQAVAAKR